MCAMLVSRSKSQFFFYYYYYFMIGCVWGHSPLKPKSWLSKSAMHSKKVWIHEGPAPQMILYLKSNTGLLFATTTQFYQKEHFTRNWKKNTFPFKLLVKLTLAAFEIVSLTDQILCLPGFPTLKKHIFVIRYLWTNCCYF